MMRLILNHRNPSALRFGVARALQPKRVAATKTEQNMFNRRNRQPETISPLTGGIVGSLVQNLLLRRVLGRGGIKGALLGAAATYALNRLTNGPRRTPARAR